MKTEDIVLDATTAKNLSRYAKFDTVFAWYPRNYAAEGSQTREQRLDNIAHPVVRMVEQMDGFKPICFAPTMQELTNYLRNFNKDVIGPWTDVVPKDGTVVWNCAVTIHTTKWIHDKIVSECGKNDLSTLGNLAIRVTRDMTRKRANVERG
jgi:hypothetical protein